MGTTSTPTRSILVAPTVPKYMPAVAEGANIKPGLMVYKTAATYGNGMTLAGALHGGLGITGRSLYIVEIVPVHLTFPKEYDIETAFTAGEGITVHRLVPGDIVRAYLADPNAAITEDKQIVCAANGQLQLWAATQTLADKEGVHVFRSVGNFADPGAATWCMVEYLGMGALDAD